jgi:hypothetical protein
MKNRKPAKNELKAKPSFERNLKAKAKESLTSLSVKLQEHTVAG